MMSIRLHEVCCTKAVWQELKGIEFEVMYYVAAGANKPCFGPLMGFWLQQDCNKYSSKGSRMDTLAESVPSNTL